MNFLPRVNCQNSTPRHPVDMPGLRVNAEQKGIGMAEMRAATINGPWRFIISGGRSVLHRTVCTKRQIARKLSLNR